MKHKYFVFLIIAVFSLCKINAQACPEASFVITSPTEAILLVYDDPGPICASRPGAIVVDGSAYVLGNCDTFSSRYILASGSGVIDTSNYTVTYGSSTCEYNDGTLGEDDIFLINKKTIKLYPNPIKNTSEVTVDFAINMSANISVYNLMGKKVLVDKMINERSKKMNISNLSNGMYLMQFDTGSMLITQKFIVNN